MQLTLLKAKLHHACVTHSELEYEGSCAIDGLLLDTAGIREYEQIHIYNKTNGARLTTYAIRAQEGSGIVSVNGAAAHKAAPGDRVIICSYAILSQQEAVSFKPTLVYLNERNQIVRMGHDIPVQVA
ncbi:MAG: aspartate 1-decarboxylase [Thiohalobacteraceae bacterium]|nr:aspartate 1-decarboxylase [Gammaproteobacteria bacterium]